MQISIEKNKTKNLYTYHLFTDGKGFFSVQKGNKTVFEDKPNTAYRIHLDSKILENFEAGCMADWVLELQDEDRLKEDFSVNV